MLVWFKFLNFAQCQCNGLFLEHALRSNYGLMDLWNEVPIKQFTPPYQGQFDDRLRKLSQGDRCELLFSFN